MKKVFQTKLKNITKVLALVIVAGLATFTGCKSYDSDISQLNTDIVTLRTDLTAQMTALNSATTTAVNAQIATLTTQLTAQQTQLTSLQTQLTALQASAATKDQITALQSQIDAVKASITSNNVSIAALQAYQATATAQILLLQTQIAAAPKQSDLTALQTSVNAQILTVTTGLSNLGATVTTLSGTVTAMNGTLTTAVSDLATLKGRVDAQLATITGLQATVTTNTADIAKLKTDLTALQASVTALQTSVTGDIATFTAAIAALQTKFAGITDNFKALAHAMSLNFAALSSRLTSLTYVPTFYVNGIEAMNFSSLTSSCLTITPAVTVVYNLNPSFIKAEDIETTNMTFAVIQSSNMQFVKGINKVAPILQPKAIFQKIENGKIYVGVSIVDYNILLKSFNDNVTNLVNGGATELFNSIALQIPLSQKAVQENQITFDANGAAVMVGNTSYPADRVITAQYVRLFSRSLAAQTDVYLARNISPSYPKLPQTVLAAKNLTVAGVDGATVTDPIVVTLPFGTTLNLADQVIAINNSVGFDIVKYGLYFKFDLLDATGNVIVYNRGSNNTDQQQFIQITNAATGAIIAKTFTQAQIDAAQGRTPIVRITMYNAQDPTCPVLMSFIKVYMADKPNPTPITIATPFTTASQVAPCDSAKTVMINVQQMNEQLYNGVSLSKADFHTIYTTLIATPGSTGNDGNIKQITDPQITDSYVVQWGLSATEIWTRLMTGSPATFTYHGTYVSTLPSVYPNINFTFTRQFTLPTTLNLTSTISNYWYPVAPNVTNTPSTSASTPMPWNYVKHNIYVPNVGETNGALAIFSNNINQAFEQNANKSLLGLANYEYYFIPNTGAATNGLYLNDNSQPIMTVNGVTYQLTPSADGQRLYNGADLVATINPFVTNTGNVLVLNQASPTAKLLLNAGAEFLKVRIGIRTVVCSNIVPNIKMPVTVNGKPWFDVVFVRPINPQPAADQYFVDALNLGDPHTYLGIATLTNLNDWRFPDPVASFATHFNYWSYYGVTNITADVANIRTDLNQAAGVTVPLAQYPDLRVYYALAVPGVTNPTATTPPTFFGYLTYQNTGNTLGVLFNLYVPVTITYSWGAIQSAQVKVPVWKTVGNSGVKRK